MDSRYVHTLTGIGSMATGSLMSALADAYERNTGSEISLIAVGGVDAAQRVRAGEAFDFAVLAAGAIDSLAADGHVERGRVDLARSEMVAAVRAGAAHPDIGSEGVLRSAVLDARRIGYSTGPSGDHLMRLLARWNLVEIVAPRLVQAPPGMPVAALLAQGMADLGFQQMSEFVNKPGIEVVAPLPAPVQLVTMFSAALCTGSNHPAAVREFLAFAESREADDIKLRCGMTPAGHDG